MIFFVEVSQRSGGEEHITDYSKHQTRRGLHIRSLCLKVHGHVHVDPRPTSVTLHVLAPPHLCQRLLLPNRHRSPGAPRAHTYPVMILTPDELRTPVMMQLQVTGHHISSVATNGGPDTVRANSCKDRLSRVSQAHMLTTSVEKPPHDAKVMHSPTQNLSYKTTALFH